MIFNRKTTKPNYSAGSRRGQYIASFKVEKTAFFTMLSVWLVLGVVNKGPPSDQPLKTSRDTLSVGLTVVGLDQIGDFDDKQ
jgi:hypothetical protein